jgi:hypothetical protein
MIVHAPRVASAVVTAGALVLIGLHARACSVRRDSAALPAAACVVAPDPSVAAAAAPPGSDEPASNEGPFDQRPPIPSVTRPCISDATELVADNAHAVLCWGERCLTDPGDLASGFPRQLTDVEPVDAVVESERVCTGTRCDRVGPRLAAAMAAMTAPTVESTRDHAAIVLAGAAAGGSDHFEAWNRAADRQIDLGSPEDDDGEIAKVTVLGDLLIVTRECMSKGCTPSLRIFDAHGPRRGSASEPSEDAQTTVIVLDAEHRVVRGAFDELVMIDHGRVTATASLSDDQTLRLDDDTFAMLRCSADDSNAACHLLWRQVEVQEPGGASAKITTFSDDSVPKCHQE